MKVYVLGVFCYLAYSGRLPILYHICGALGSLSRSAFRLDRSRCTSRINLSYISRAHLRMCCFCLSLCETLKLCCFVDLGNCFDDHIYLDCSNPKPEGNILYQKS